MSRNRLCFELLEARDVPTVSITPLANVPTEPVSAPYVAGLGTMMELTNGDILVQGGGLTPVNVSPGMDERVTNQFYLLTPDSGGDYTDATWSAAASMDTPRLYYGSNDLPNGDVFVLGGEFSGFGYHVTYLNSAVEYDPVANTWIPDGNSPSQVNGVGGVGDVPTALLANGQVLTGAPNTNDTYLYTPGAGATAGTWSMTFAPKLYSDVSVEEGWSTLQDNTVLSYDVSEGLNDQPGHPYQAQRYVPPNLDIPGTTVVSPADGEWVDASHLSPTDPPSILSDNQVGDELGASLRMPSGQFVDGLGNAHSSPEGAVFVIGATGATAFYDPSGTIQNPDNSYTLGTWTAGFPLPTLSDGTQLVAADAPAAELPDGNVVLALSPLGTLTAGSDHDLYDYPSPTYLYEFSPNATTEATAYTPITLPPALQVTLQGDGSLTNPNGVPSYDTRMLVAPNGHVLLSINDSTQVWDISEDGSPSDSWRPTVTGITNNNGTFTLSGTQLTGVSEGAAYGDDAEMSTNFPIVKLTSDWTSTSYTWYATTTNWTPGIAEGASQVTFTLPTNLPVLYYNYPFSLTVVASGVSSNPVDFANPDPGPVYADSTWTGLSNYTSVDPDPDDPGGVTGTIGVNCFATIGAAVAAAEGIESSQGSSIPIPVIVNGDAGPSGSGLFTTDDVAVNSAVPLFLHHGDVAVNSLRSDPNDPNPGAEQVILDGVNLNTDGYFDSSNGGYDAYSGKFVGSGGVIKDGTGTLNPDGTNDGAAGMTVTNGLFVADRGFPGPFTVTATGSNSGGTITSGTLQLGSATVLQNCTVAVNTYGNLDLNGFNPTFDGLAGDGTVNLASGQTLTVGVDDDETTFSGSLLGAGSFVKAGPSTLTLTGSDQLTGNTTVAGGVLQIGDGQTVATVGAPITDNADVVLDQPGPATIDQDINGTGQLNKIGSGVLTLTGDSNLVAGVFVDEGDLTVDGTLDANTSGASVVAISPGGTLSGDGTINAMLGVSGTLTPSGTLTTGQVSFNDNGAYGKFLATLNTPTTGYGRLVAGGDVYLTGATLSVNLAPGYTPYTGDSQGVGADEFDVIHTGPASHVSGTFANAPGSGSAIWADGSYFSVAYSDHDATLTAIATPLASSNAVVVNDGSAQRSEVRSITVTFSTLVSFQGGAANAFALVHLSGDNGAALSGGAHNVLLSATTMVVSGHTVVVLTFSGNETDPISMTGNANTVAGPSFSDGLYQLSTGTYTSPADTSGNIQLGLFRLFGDVTGNGVVDAQDLGQFRDAYNTSVGDPLYLAYLDANNNGVIDAPDERQFDARYNASVFP